MKSEALPDGNRNPPFAVNCRQHLTLSTFQHRGSADPSRQSLVSSELRSAELLGRFGMAIARVDDDM